MDILGGLLTSIVQTILNVIQALGYPGIFGLMALESMALPIPGEVILTFGGALVSQGHLVVSGNELVDTFLVALAGTFGCTVGSLIAYYIGIKGGRPLVLRYGRYVLLNKDHLDTAEKWFVKYGDKAVFASRLLPVIRTFISIPAGIFEMDLRKFIIYTTVGSLPWCLALSYLGLYLGNNWESIQSSYNLLVILVIVGFVIAVTGWLLWKWWKRKKQQVQA